MMAFPSMLIGACAGANIPVPEDTDFEASYKKVKSLIDGLDCVEWYDGTFGHPVAIHNKSHDVAHLSYGA